MRVTIRLLLLACAFVVAGCATVPQQPVQLTSNSLEGSRIGVSMTTLPKVDTHLIGADCLLCMAAAAIANSSLTDHTRTLPYEDVPQLKEAVAQLLRNKGVDVTVIAEPLNIDDLKKSGHDDQAHAKKDFSPLGQKYGIDKLMVINITMMGFHRTYSSYIPTSDPKAVFQGEAYIVDVRDHSYQWYAPITVLRSSDGQWDEPPTFPGLTNAYFQALEHGKDSVLKPFAGDALAADSN